MMPILARMERYPIVTSQSWQQHAYPGVYGAVGVGDDHLTRLGCLSWRVWSGAALRQPEPAVAVPILARMER